MHRRTFLHASGLWLAGAGCSRQDPARPAASPVPLQPDAVYVWQRRWTASVSAAVAVAGPGGAAFGTVCFLAAERESGGTGPAWKTVRPDYPALKKSGAQVAAALRVGVVREPLLGLSGEIRAALERTLTEARAAGVELAEWHLDLDCPRSRLAEYVALMDSILSSMESLPPCWITALPDWLGDPEFVRLARRVGRYILQVHALELPPANTTETLMCDPAKARRQVAQAGALGVPFVVALPTYASRIFYGPDNKVLDVAAEDGAAGGPAGTVRKCLVRSDATALAALVQEWRAQPPAACQGLIWYRLPVEDDSWNWTQEGLAEVRSGRAPVATVRFEAIRQETGYYEITAQVEGGVEARIPQTLEVSGPVGVVVIAGDVHGNWKRQMSGGRLRFIHGGGWLFPGRTMRPGWVRLNRPTAPVLTIFP